MSCTIAASAHSNLEDVEIASAGNDSNVSKVVAYGTQVLPPIFINLQHTFSPALLPKSLDRKAVTAVLARTVR